MKSYVKTRSGREEIEAHRIESAELPDLQWITIKRRRKSIQMAVEYICLDTETSHYGLDCAWIYQWAMRIAGVYIYGRTAPEIIRALEVIRDHYGLSDQRKIMVCIHNASYDIQYLKHYLRIYDPDMEILATGTHDLLNVDVRGFRIICSYRLTNLSLAILAKNFADTYQKAVGEIDYNIRRFPDSELTESDWYYMFSDVAAQYDGVSGYIKAMGYEYLAKAPITSTGFVRRDCQRRAHGEINSRQKFLKSALDLRKYDLCRQAFMGGVTIASFLYAGYTVRSDKLRHLDFTSSYPARQMMDYAPQGSGTWTGPVTDEKEFRILLKRYCCIFVLTLTGVRIRAGVTAPYIPHSKCIHSVNVRKDNGKVTGADSLTIAVTEIDFKWIERQYIYESKIVTNMMIFPRGPFPAWMRSAVMDYFRGKCTLKKKDPVLYAAQKARLNSVYGMSVTATIRPEFKFDADLVLRDNDRDLSDEELRRIRSERLEKYYDSRNSFNRYQQGIYVTAHARDALMTMIECVGYENFLYCDTDSVFYLETEDNRRKLEEMNARIRERAAAAGAVIGDNILGYATPEDPPEAFRALHAKCYAQEIGGKLSITIAGIPKQATIWENGEPLTVTSAEELGDIDNLKDGFTFRACGGTRSIYLEDPPQCRIIDGHRVEYASSVIIEPIEKVISSGMWSFDAEGFPIHMEYRPIITE